MYTYIYENTLATIDVQQKKCFYYKIPGICNTNVGAKLHDATGNRYNKVQRGDDGLQLSVCCWKYIINSQHQVKHQY